MDESPDLQSCDFDLRTNAGDVPDDWFDLQGLVSKGPGPGLRDTTQRAQAEVMDSPGSELTRIAVTDVPTLRYLKRNSTACCFDSVLSGQSRT